MTAEEAPTPSGIGLSTMLTDRQRADLHAGIYEYLLSLPGDAFARAAAAVAEADPDVTRKQNNGASGVPILEKKWTAVPRLQKKVLELEKTLASNSRIHGHRLDSAAGPASPAGGRERRMIPRPPAVHTLKGHSGVVGAVAVHPVFTVAVSGSEDGTVKVWDHESGEYMRTLKGHTNTVHSVAFSPTGSHLASSSSDLSIKLWDFNTYTCVRTLRGHDHTISAVRFVPLPISELGPSAATSGAPPMANSSGPTSTAGENTSSTSATGIDVGVAGAAFIVSASRDRTVKFWDLATGFCDHTLADHSDWVRCVAVRDEDGELLATSGNDQVILVYNAANDRKKIAELRGHTHVVEAIAFVTSPPPASAESRSAAAGAAGAVVAPHSKASDADTVRDYLASGGRDRTVRLWTISSGQCIAVFSQHENWVRSVILHPSGNFIITAGDDRTIRVFDVKSNRCLRTIDNAHPHFVTSVAMHYTLPVLISGGVDQTVKCWQLD